MAKKKSNRGKGSFAIYKAENRSAKNKARAIARHIKQNPNDDAAKAALKAAPGSKSARFGYKGPKTERPKREDQIFDKQVRKAQNVLKTVKDVGALVLGDRLLSSYELKSEFNFPRSSKK